MKMSEEHYNFLLRACKKQLPHIKENCKTTAQELRLTGFETRMLFDAFYFCKTHTIFSPQEFNYKDAHIKAAMKKIFKELNISTNQEDYKNV